MTQDTYKGSPWQPWTQNLYVYVGNNPVNYIDPTGHCAWAIGSGGADLAVGCEGGGGGGGGGGIGGVPLGQKVIEAVALAYVWLQGLFENHHPWPKYLGGPKDQDLIVLPTNDHIDLHKIMDKLVGTRNKGKAFYDILSREEKGKILKNLLDLYRNNPNLCPGCEEALKKELEKAGESLAPTPLPTEESTPPDSDGSVPTP